ncbi:hypothetical protein G4G27_07005 [Sphingomonas sp. So64.6b]|uniref:hypothetical protein n=1 Tax=Sphingomonas sp. So64.6b TaxID=2997354 RepID=UPI00160075E6|nr:hypothetical protein [Sphingomonas sp. So64.6b]QNA83764.1 hypothetical protein G4G27_07005 [Sphingomonas sp. So64.6b]
MDRTESKPGEIDNQTWLIDDGHAIIEKKRAGGIDALTPRERLIHCFWIADYSMRNAGDLATARDLDPRYLSDARSVAALLDLPVTAAAFGLSEGELERRFFDLFDRLCDELRGR